MDENQVEFQWPSGTQAQLRVYPQDHPQRKPTEEYFEGVVRNNIEQARGGDYTNLWLMIESLKDLSDPQPHHHGFHSFFWAIEGVLGADSCREIGKKACKAERFTLKEAERHMEDYRRKEAESLNLKKSATWDEIREARSKKQKR